MRSPLRAPRLASFCLALGLLFVVPAAHAATITITTAADELNADGDCSLREAVTAANTDAAVDACTAGSGADTIVYTPELVGGMTTLTGGQLDVTSTITLNGLIVPNVVTMTLIGSGSRLFRVATGASLTLNTIILTNGTADVGGAILAESGSTLSLTLVAASGNTATGAAATQGGGFLYSDGAAVTISESRFVSNTATGAAGSGGALFNNGGTMSISGTMMQTNTSNRAGGAIEVLGGTTTLAGATLLDGNNAGTAPGNGGGLHVSGAGTVTVTDGTFQNNVAVEGGGLWCSSGCTMALTGTTVRTNTASGSDGPTQGGGGLYNDGALTVTNATLTGNTATGTAGSGGGILNVGGTLAVNGGVLAQNTAVRAGGGIETNAGTVVLGDVAFTSNGTGNSPGNGGALHVTGMGTVTATGGTVATNTAAREGGGFWNDAGTMTVTGTTFDQNTAAGPAGDDGGGALFNNGGTMVLLNVTATGNRATGASGSGGAVLNLGGMLRMNGGTLSGNMANRAGAGIENATGPTRPGTAELTGVTVTTNSIATAAPGNGGGLHSGGGTVTVRGGAFTGNTAVEGGGLWSNASMTLAPDSSGAPVVVTGNTATGADATQGGGGVYAETGADVRLTDVTLDGNLATGTAGSGGGLLVADGSAVVVNGGSISGNMANRAGAGIELADDVTTAAATALVVTWATIDGNSIATAAPGNGGGLHIGGAGVATIRKSTFSGNTAREGAGLWMAGTSTLDLALSTVSGNMATEDGGGVYDNGGASSATITLVDATVAGNTAGGIGGGLLSESTDGASYQVKNSIVADNTAATGADCSGQIGSQGYNLFENTAGCTFSGQTALDLTGMDPMLGPLADNGGPTMTHLPMAGSPALNAGQSDYKVDQRDFLRAVGQEDIGAVEFGAQPVPGEDTPEAGETTFALAAPSPNPTRGQTTIRFTLADAQPALVTLHDLLGRTVATLYDAAAPAGAEQTVRVDVSGFAPGVYLIRLVSGDQVATGRVTVIR